MGKYVIVWRVAALPLATVGSMIALLTQPMPFLVEWAIVIAALSCLVHDLTYHRDESIPRSAQEYGPPAATGAAAAVAAAGAVIALGPLVGTLTVALIAVTSPPTVRRLHRGAAHPDQLPTPTQGHADRGREPDLRPHHRPLTAAADLTDPELCWAWRSTFTALQRTPHQELRALVDTRAAILDELEHRHPTGFARWLHSNPRAAGDPTRYVAPPPHPVRHRN
ncbi:hypothetical protein GCM10027047_14340 [Rhodococcus aerolatus]